MQPSRKKITQECVNCRGSGGGTGYWRCGSCNGRGSFAVPEHVVDDHYIVCEMNVNCQGLFDGRGEVEYGFLCGKEIRLCEDCTDYLDLKQCPTCKYQKIEDECECAL